jgi:serine/threonine protein kinase
VKDALISEIRIMKKLKNESIVGFIDIIETANNYYVIQELCTGGDLKTAIKKAKHFTEVQAIEYLKQMLEGFQELIQNSIVHRDVKPENILINNGRLKLADFGFAKNVVSHNTLQKSMVGTPLYMAPQILKRERYSSKCDVWSVGVVFYEV